MDLMFVDLGVGAFSAQFGCLSWSRCEHKLLYVAEKSRKTSAETRRPQPEWTKVPKHTQTRTKYFSSPIRRRCVCVCVPCAAVPVPNQDRSVYCEDWGEALTNKSLPVICSVILQSGSVGVLEGVPSDVSPGQVRTESLRASLQAQPSLGLSPVCVSVFAVLSRLCGLPAVSLFSLSVGTTSPSDWDSSSAPTAGLICG